MYVCMCFFLWGGGGGLLTYYSLVLIGRVGLITNFGGGHNYLLVSLCFENKVIKRGMIEVASGSQVAMLV
jgi:hypothetical protein